MAAATQEPKAQEQPKASTSFTWLQEAEEMLLKAGWKRAGIDARGLPMFTDPTGSNEPVMYEHTTKRTDAKGEFIKEWRPRKTMSVFLPTKEGNVEEFKQVLGGPIPWDYSIDEAARIQRERDARPERDATEKAVRDEAKRVHEENRAKQQPQRR